MFTFHGYRFEILRKSRNKITAIRIKPLSAATATGQAASRSRRPLSAADTSFAGSKALRNGFARSKRRQRQRMDAALQFVLQKVVDEAMALDARLPGKSLGDDEDAEMAFARSGRVRWPACSSDSLMTSSRVGRSASINFSRTRRVADI